MKITFYGHAALGIRINDVHHAKAVARISDLLAEVDERLSDGRNSILGGETINYTDIAFAAIMGLWLMPPNYGGGRADSTRIEIDRCPPAMRGQVEQWKTNHPRAVAYIERLYRDERRRPA